MPPRSEDPGEPRYDGAIRIAEGALSRLQVRYFDSNMFVRPYGMRGLLVDDFSWASVLKRSSLSQNLLLVANWSKVFDSLETLPHVKATVVCHPKELQSDSLCFAGERIQHTAQSYDRLCCEEGEPRGLYFNPVVTDLPFQ